MNDFETVIKEKQLSVRPCEVCQRPVGIRNTRIPNVLCGYHTNKVGSISRYTNFQHGKLTVEEANRVNSDRTTRRGPFGK